MSILFQIAVFRLHLQGLRSAIVASHHSSNWSMKVARLDFCAGRPAVRTKRVATHSMLKLSTLVATAYPFAIRSRTDLRPETKRARVSDVASRGVAACGATVPDRRVACLHILPWLC
jgi:hypothetical protein